MTQIAAGYAATGEYRRAFQIAETIEKAGSKSRALSQIVSHASPDLEAGQKDKASEIQKLIKQLQLAPNTRSFPFDNQADALQVIAGQYAVVGEHDRAIAVVQTIQKPNAKAAALRDIAWNYAEAGEYDRAIAVAQTIQETYTKAAALQEIARKYAEAEKYDRAIAVAQTIEDTSMRNNLIRSLECAARKR